ncbi:right-handed parallel beta-helix repeat-containing protein [Halorussus ruber]|uniref:right-handed parallel beta-helix repeat-containing protein n=1 Tax=Halorussus ruber TaxID=1126238 RepID=UPI001091F822|nr:right-handed parallel beta-helix repeat-containing protein [Halorussus ruber]
MTSRDVRTLGVLFVALALAVGGGAVVGAGLTGAASPTDAAQNSIDSCTTIDQSGTYVLTKDIENGGKTPISKSCITITADDVTFDGDGHRIDGRGVSHTKAIAVKDAEGVTVENVEVNDWHAGLLVKQGSATLQNVTTFSNAYGVRLEQPNDVRLENSNVSDNLVGVYTDNRSLTLDGTKFSENELKIQRDGG